MLGRPRKGIPRARPPPQAMIHILESDYNKLVMSRQYPRETIYDILHRKIDRLEQLERNYRDLQTELDGYKEFIITKGLERELHTFLYKTEDVEDETPKASSAPADDFIIRNKYPNWDV